MPGAGALPELLPARAAGQAWLVLLASTASIAGMPGCATAASSCCSCAAKLAVPTRPEVAAAEDGLGAGAGAKEEFVTVGSRSMSRLVSGSGNTRQPMSCCPVHA